MILQSLSQGKDTYSYKLHSIVIGPPGVGKSYLTKAAKILNPFCEEISGSSRKLTPAGLIGWKDKNDHYIKGLLPRNSGGCVFIQDFQTLKSKSRDEVLGILSKMMEDGEVIDSTSAVMNLIAETSIHLDMNRKSRIYKNGKFSAYSDIDIPINTISRFDFILDMIIDEQHQKGLADAIARGKKKVIIKNKYWKNELKSLIALLRSNYKEVRCASDIEQYRVDRYNELMEDVCKKSGSTSVTLDMETRLSRSIEKYIKAIATAYATDEVTKEMVDYAFRFIEKKVEFLFTLSEQSQSQKDPDDLLLECIPDIFHELVPDISSEEGKFYDTEEVFSRYAAKNNIAIAEKNPKTQKSKLSNLLNEHFGIEAKTKYFPKVKKKGKESGRCYLLNNDNLKQLELIKNSQHSDEGKQPVEPKKMKVKSRGFRDKGRKKE